MSDILTVLFDGSLANVFGNPLLLGIVFISFVIVIILLAQINKILMLPLLLFVSYSLAQYGIIPMALFAGILLLTALIFALSLLNAIFNN